MAPFDLLALFSCLLVFVAAVPTFEHIGGSWDVNMGSLVPGATYLEAIGREVEGEVRRSRHLNVHDPGFPGNITVIPNTRRPELFYIHQNQLYQMINQTTVYTVNVMNTTKLSDYPLQLISSKTREGNTGVWRWQGTTLVYSKGKLSNGGLYYECTIKDGFPGVFTFLLGSPPPEECSPITLHGFNRLFMDQSKR